MSATYRARPDLRDASSEAAPAAVCLDCGYAEAHSLHVGTVCRHPSHEYSGQLLFEGQRACVAFKPRHAHLGRRLFSYHKAS